MTKSNQKIISPTLLEEIKEALESVKFGSIEIFVQNKVVTQITVRNIHKTSVEIEPDQQRIHVTAHTHAEGGKIQSNIIMRKSALKMR